jgi:hypothetical protein
MLAAALLSMQVLLLLVQSVHAEVQDFAASTASDTIAAAAAEC